MVTGSCTGEDHERFLAPESCSLGSALRSVSLAPDGLETKTQIHPHCAMVGGSGKGMQGWLGLQMELPNAHTQSWSLPAESEGGWCRELPCPCPPCIWYIYTERSSACRAASLPPLTCIVTRAMGLGEKFPVASFSLGGPSLLCNRAPEGL